MKRLNRITLVSTFIMPVLAVLAVFLTPLGASSAPVSYNKPTSPPDEVAYPHMFGHLVHAVRTKWFYTVRSGDTYSALAKRFYGHASRWPAMWIVNRWHDKNPNALPVGMRLTLESWHPKKAWITTDALAAIPKPPAVHTVLATVHHYSSYHAPTTVSTSTGVTADVSTSGMGGFQACVIAHESGGDPTAHNPSSTASGAYQFLLTTWYALGYGAAYPGGAATAPMSVQTEAFWKEVAQSGTSAWAPYDGC